jgi:hypothetical protein
MTRQQLILWYRQYDPDAHFYTWEEVLALTRQSYPDWPEKRLQGEADRVFTALQDEEARWFRSQQRFFEHVYLTPDVEASMAGQHPDEED